MVTQGCNSPILITISSMASCMAIFITYGTASMAHTIPMKLCPCMNSCRRFWALYTHTMITNNLVWYRFKHHMHTSSLRIHSRSKSQPASFHRVEKLLISTSIILYLSAAPQHAVADNSEMFFEAGEGYDKGHRCGINNPKSSDITREKKVAVASCPTSL